jgi:hypothetical protein
LDLKWVEMIHAPAEVVKNSNPVMDAIRFNEMNVC